MKKSTLLKAVGAIALLSLAIGGFFFYQTWNAPQRDVRTEKGIAVSAQAIVDAYAGNEKLADSLYLDKAIEVTGTVAELSKNQQGKAVVALKTNDALAGVRCTMKEESTLKMGDSVRIKGKCTGFLMDVTLIDCYLEKQ